MPSPRISHLANFLGTKERIELNELICIKIGLMTMFMSAPAFSTVQKPKLQLSLPPDFVKIPHVWSCEWQPYLQVTAIEREREHHFTSMFQALMDLLDEAHSYMKKSTAREAFLPRQRKPNATMQH